MNTKVKRPFTRLQKTLLMVFLLTLLLVLAQAVLLVIGHFQLAALLREYAVEIPKGAANVGIIGGADGPTAIYTAVSVTTGTLLVTLLIPGGICLASGIALLVSRRRQRQR